MDINGQAGGGVQLSNSSPWTSAQTITPAGTANTKSDAVFLTTLGTATATGTQFLSGSIHLACSGWGSTAPAAQLMDWQLYALPVAGTGTTSSILYIDYQNETTGGGYFHNFGIVSTASVQGSALIGNNGGSGSLWLGATTLTTATKAVLTSNGASLQVSCPSNSSTLNMQVGGIAVLNFQNCNSITSATSATWNGISVPGITLTVTGSTAITTATGFNLANIVAPVISTSSTVAVTVAATLAITGAPTITGASSSITTAYTLWLQGGNLGQAGVTSLYNNVVTKGAGQPAIYGLDNRTGLASADGSATTLYTTTGANQLYRISADIFATAAVTGTANYTITWTENSTTQTAVVSATAINVLGTSTQIIRPDNATAITAQLTGTFTGTFSVVGIVERLA